MTNKDKIKFIKICGLTDPDTAVACVNAGASAIGLVFYKKSPRNVSNKNAFEICQALPQKTITTGVFVDEDFNFIIQKVNKFSLKAVQLHGNESPKLIKALRDEGLIVIKGIFASKNPHFNNSDLYENATYLLAECGEGILPGGNAKTWNWQEINKIPTKLPIILAGGLNPSNIHKAISRLNITGIDVSSGVESSPGIKDIDKITKFINNVKGS